MYTDDPSKVTTPVATTLGPIKDDIPRLEMFFTLLPAIPGPVPCVVVAPIQNSKKNALGVNPRH